MEEELNIKFQGKIFTQCLDLRDIAFFSKKISNISDKAYSAYTGKNSDLKDKYQIYTKSISHSSLELELLLNYGVSLSPVLLQSPLTVWEVAQKAIEIVYKLGELFKKEQKVNISLENSTITNLVIGNGTIKTEPIPTPIYQAMLNMDNDIKDINKKIANGDVKDFSLNKESLMNSNTVPYFEKGLDIVDHLKEEIAEDKYIATIDIYEFHKHHLTGKAKILSHNIFGIDVKENIDFDVPEHCIDEVIKAMSNDSIKVVFKAIIENTLSKKTLKRMLLQECSDDKES